MGFEIGTKTYREHISRKVVIGRNKVTEKLALTSLVKILLWSSGEEVIVDNSHFLDTIKLNPVAYYIILEHLTILFLQLKIVRTE